MYSNIRNYYVLSVTKNKTLRMRCIWPMTVSHALTHPQATVQTQTCWTSTQTWPLASVSPHLIVFFVSMLGSARYAWGHVCALDHVLPLCLSAMCQHYSATSKTKPREPRKEIKLKGRNRLCNWVAEPVLMKSRQANTPTHKQSESDGLVCTHGDVFDTSSNTSVFTTEAQAGASPGLRPWLPAESLNPPQGPLPNLGDDTLMERHTSLSASTVSQLMDWWTAFLFLFYLVF